MEFKKYSKENDYSFAFGGFPTFELLKYHPESVECLIIHDKLEKSEEKNKYFDEQIIKLPAGKCMRQIGVYSKYSDTYPVVKIAE